MNFKKNIVLQVGYEILSLLLPLVTTPYISRVLGAERLGLYSYSYSVVYYFQLFALLGIKYYGTREIAAVCDQKERRNYIFTGILGAHILVSFVSLLGYIIFVMLSCGSNRTIFLIQAFNVVAALLDINWFFFGIEMFKITVTRNTVIKILTVICVFIFVKSAADLWKYTLIMALGCMISQSIVWLFVFRFTRIVKVSLEDVLSHIKPMIVLFVPIVSISVLKYMDKIMLGIVSTNSQVGYYDYAHKIIEMPSALIVAVGTVMLPRISNLFSNGGVEKSRRYTLITYKYLMALSIGMSFGLASIADIFSVVFWGIDFAPCGKIIKILALSVPFTAYSNITRTQYLMPLNKDSIYIKSTVYGMVGNLGLNLLLIKRFQANGVALATLISEIIITLYQIVMVHKESNQIKIFKSFCFFIIPGAIMYLVLLLVPKHYNVTVLIFNVVLGTIIYSTLCFMYLYITKDVYLETLLKKMKK